MRIEKSTRQRFSTGRHQGDIAIDLKGNEAQSQEILRETEELLSKSNIMFGGLNDQLWGTDAWVEGARNPQRDVLGNVSDMVRLRRRKKIIDLTDK